MKKALLFLSLSLLLAFCTYASADQQPPTDIDPPFFENAVRFGMSQKEVIDIQGNKPDIFDSTALVYYDTVVMNTQATTAYQFIDDALASTLHILDPECRTFPEYHSVFETIRDELTEKYGEPTLSTNEIIGDEYDTSSLQDYQTAYLSADIRYSVNWEQDGVTIYLNLFKDTDGSIVLLLTYDNGFEAYHEALADERNE